MRLALHWGVPDLLCIQQAPVLAGVAVAGFHSQETLGPELPACSIWMGTHILPAWPGLSSLPLKGRTRDSEPAFLSAFTSGGSPPGAL